MILRRQNSRPNSNRRCNMKNTKNTSKHKIVWSPQSWRHAQHKEQFNSVLFFFCKQYSIIYDQTNI